MKEEAISNTEIVVYALYLLNGADNPIHLEHITLKCYELDKGRFRWLYFDIPDKMTVQKRLYDATRTAPPLVAKPRNEAGGWKLTVDGVKWVKGNKTKIEKSIGLSKEDKRVVQQARSRLKKQLESEIAFKTYLKDGNVDNVSLVDFTNLLKCAPDSSIEILYRKYRKLFSRAVEAEEEPAISFLESCYQKFLGEYIKGVIE